jgi:VanZ family protein
LKELKLCVGISPWAMEEHRPTARWPVLWWGLVLVWFVVIWWFGESQALPMTASGDAGRWLLRKALHLFVYGVLGGLLALALGSRDRPAWVVGLCLLVALGDEVHQSFVPQRAFRLHDLGIDALGGAVGMLVAGAVVPRALGWAYGKRPLKQ